MSAKNILLVEDDIDIRENMARVLKYEGYHVMEAEHGAEAMKMLENKKEIPDLILLDLFMPVMNGREFLDAVETNADKKLKDIPVILVTASEQNAHQDLEKRTAAVIRKPIELRSFLRMLTKMIQ